MNLLKILLFYIVLLPVFTFASETVLIRNMPVDVEGVYQAKNSRGDVVLISLLQNMATKNITVTVSTPRGRILFFTGISKLGLQEDNRITVKAASVDLKGVRKHISFVIDPAEETIEGSVETNFLESEGTYTINGTKKSSLIDLLREESSSTCPENKKITGLYKGYFGSSSKGVEELRIRFIFDESGELQPTAYVLKGIMKLLYHDGFVSKSLGLLSLVSDSSYAFTGKARKLMLLCTVSEGNIILKGIHISSTGQVIKNIEFKKIQE